MATRLHVVATIDTIVGLVWVLGALSLLTSGDGMTAGGVLHELLGSRIVILGGATATGVETYLGLRFLLRDRPTEARTYSVVLLLVLTAMLVVRGVSEGWAVTCSCIDLLGHQSALAGVVRNVMLMLVLGAAAWLERYARTKMSSGQRH